MSTNDTLRGLLAEAKDYVNFCTTTEAGDLLNRISAALAEPVSGGVVLPERQRVKADANYNWNIGYNQALDDVAALNGGAVAGQSDAARDVLAERQRQISAEGWTTAHDDKYTGCELAAAAATYAVCTDPEQLKICGAVAWPWLRCWWKPVNYRRNLVKAGALLLAEIERIDRQGRDACTCKPLESERGGE